MPQYVRDLVGSLFILFFGFGYKGLKVGREYMVNVFNGFINAWFWFLILTSYDYADIWEWLKNFLFFCITIFPEQAQNKTKSGSKRLFFFINDENT